MTAGSAPDVSRVVVHRVVVLGAGVMGAQIAALAANAGLDVDLLDLPDGDDPAGRARLGIERLRAMRPAPLFLPSLADHIRPGSLTDVEPLRRADWVIEAVVEDLETKRQLLAQIEPHLSATAILSSNTSGLPIASLSEALSPSVQQRFLGIHFFNPPRFMKLVEVIAGPMTDPVLVEGMSALCQSRLGKSVIPCRDRPNFIANRLGIFAVTDALHRMQDHGLTVEQVDAATGPLLGRPRSATLRLCDLIGLDTLLHVAATSHDGIEPHPGHERLAAPSSVRQLVDAGHLGSKSGAGFYRKGEQGIEAARWSGAQISYAPVQQVETDLPSRGSIEQRLDAVFASADPLARYAREHLLAVLAYSAACAPEIAFGLEDVDRAMCWGFNWEIGPFGIIDHLGTARVIDGIAAQGIDVPPLLEQIAQADPPRAIEPSGVFDLSGSGSRRVARAVPATDEQRLAQGTVAAQTDGAQCVSLQPDGFDVVQLRGKLNTLPPDVLRFIQDSVSSTQAEIVILHGAGGTFSAGADLKYVLGLIENADWDALEQYLQLFQQTTSALRYAAVPVVSAATGLALGGGCELCLTSAGRVLAGELRMGLVETKVGVIPGAGGCKEMVRRVGADIESTFATLQVGAMSDSALQARDWGFIEDEDPVLLDTERLLVAAHHHGLQLLKNGWTPPLPAPLPVAGLAALARIEHELEQQQTAGTLTEHDVTVGRALAWTLCGGGETGAVDEQHLLDCERESFLRLCGMQATRERIEHMLRTGKPLRN